MKNKTLLIELTPELEHSNMEASSLNDAIELLALMVHSVEDLFKKNDLQFNYNGLTEINDILRVMLIKNLKQEQINVPLFKYHVDINYSEELKDFTKLVLEVKHDFEDKNELFSHVMNVLLVYLASSIADLLRSMNKAVQHTEIINVTNEFYVDALTSNNEIIYERLYQQLEDLFNCFN